MIHDRCRAGVAPAARTRCRSGVAGANRWAADGVETDEACNDR